MTFVIDEIGYDTSQPIEIYRFTGTLREYLYTSANITVVDGARTYDPVPIQRTGIVLGDVTEKNEVKIYMPITTDLVKDYAFDISPPDLEVEIFRCHGVTGEVVAWFKGTVTSVVVEGIKATFVIPSLFSNGMQGEFPNVVYQSQCNHNTFGPRCGLNRDDWKATGTVAEIVDRTHIRVAAAASQADGYYLAGEVIKYGEASNQTERRLIVDHTGDLLTMNYPFRNILEGMTVELYAGDDHNLSTCKNKFNNLVNFFGFPYTPSLNPFVSGLK